MNFRISQAYFGNKLIVVHFLPLSITSGSSGTKFQFGYYEWPPIAIQNIYYGQYIHIKIIVIRDLLYIQNFQFIFSIWYSQPTDCFYLWNVCPYYYKAQRFRWQSGFPERENPLLWAEDARKTNTWRRSGQVSNRRQMRYSTRPVFQLSSQTYHIVHSTSNRYWSDKEQFNTKPYQPAVCKL